MKCGKKTCYTKIKEVEKIKEAEVTQEQLDVPLRL